MRAELSLSLPVAEFRLPRIATTALLVVVAVGLMVLMVLAPVDRNLRNLDVVGATANVTPEQIRQVLVEQAGKGFFGMDVEQARDQIDALPWVKRARVERIWPSGIRVQVWQRTPMARWNDGELLDQDAEAFNPGAARVADGLPELVGPQGQSAEVAQAWNALKTGLDAGRYPLVRLARDARGSWQARTAQGIELKFGQQDPASLIPMLNGPVARSLEGRMDDVASIDLRYTNGFAVGWRDGKSEVKTDG